MFYYLWWGLLENFRTWNRYGHRPFPSSAFWNPKQSPVTAARVQQELGSILKAYSFSGTQGNWVPLPPSLCSPPQGIFWAFLRSPHFPSLSLCTSLSPYLLPQQLAGLFHSNRGQVLSSSSPGGVWKASLFSDPVTNLPMTPDPPGITTTACSVS